MGSGVHATVHEKLAAAAARLRTQGVVAPSPEGKLLRPAVAAALVSPHCTVDSLPEEFWMGALAIQMVHEASLLHDDILDHADVRRGRPTVACEDGLAQALVLGDRYLTGAYRAAAAAGKAAFLHGFVEAVERTVAGEMAQEQSCGHPLSLAQYESIISDKSGELFGASALLAAEWTGADPERARALGCAIGSLYQMVDDFLDYCPEARTGKRPYQDYGQKKWTFVLADAGIRDFHRSTEGIHRVLFPPQGISPMTRALARLQQCRDDILGTCDDVFQARTPLAPILDGWILRAEEALRVERAAVEGVEAPGLERLEVQGGAATGMSAAEAQVADRARRVGGPDMWSHYFGHHSKSFRFSSMLFPAEPRRAVTGVYAFCRFTDDLADESRVPPPEARALVEAWRGLARAAYDGSEVGVPLVDHVMGQAAREGVPFHYVDDLLTGVASDLEPVRFATLADLEVYTYRVASVVGGWMTELFGVHRPEVLSRAYALGHAMQLTNILRDVGEDMRRGRIYIPTELLARFDVDEGLMGDLADHGRVTDGYVGLMEHLMGVADRHYDRAFEAIPALPPFYRRPVAVAARIYQGIHDEIRRNGYDNGTRRAYTSLTRKVTLAYRGLRQLGWRPAEPDLAGDLVLAHPEV